MGAVHYNPRHNEGYLTHYHHFLSGYLLPVLVDSDDARVHTVSMLSCGPMDSIIYQCGIKIREGGTVPKSWHIRRVPGYDGSNCPIPSDWSDKVNAAVDCIFDISADECASSKDEILLIDRGPKPVAVDANKPILEYAGAERRTLHNIDELEQCLQTYGLVRRCILEKLSFRDQILMFRRAKFIVAQHGAGLSNLIFATGCKRVIEFSNPAAPKETRWFNSLCEHMGMSRRVVPAIVPAGKGRSVQAPLQSWGVDIERTDAAIKDLLGKT